MMLSWVLIFLLFPVFVWAQPTYLSVTSISGTAATSCSGSVNATGTNALLVAVINLGSAAPVSTVSSVTYNGVAANYVINRVNTQDQANVEVWVKHAPTTGSNTFEATFSDLADFDCEVYIFENAHQSAAVGNTTSDTNVGTNISLNLASNSSQLVIDAVLAEGTGYTTGCTPGGSQTEHYDTEASPGMLRCSSTLTGAVSTTMTQTLGAAGYWTALAVALKAPASPAATTRRRSIVQ